MFDLSIQARLGQFTLDATVSSDARVVGIVGESGHGKTSLLNAIAGLLNTSDAHIVIDDKILTDTKTHIFLPAQRRGIGYVFQDALLFPHLTVRQNLRYAAGAHGLAPDETAVVEVLELGQLLTRKPDQLSGGQARRVAIGRALLSGPRLLLLDEPITGLDRRLANKTLLLLRRVLDTFNIPTLYVSHALSDIIFLCEQAWLMHSGRITSVGSPQAMLTNIAQDNNTPWHDLTNVFSGRITNKSQTTPTSIRIKNTDLIANTSVVDSTCEVIVSVSASDIILAQQKPVGLSARNIVPGVVHDITTHGTSAIIFVDAGERWMIRLTLTALEELALTPGRPVFMIIKASSIHITT